MSSRKRADVCLILEGTYPYVAGGVSSWTHELLTRQDHLTFHLVSIIPRGAKTEPVYSLPPNVVSLTNLYLQEVPEGPHSNSAYGSKIRPRLRKPLEALMEHGHLKDYKTLYDLIAPEARRLGQRVLLDSEESWQLLIEMYHDSFSEASFLDYFWSWRAILGGLYSLLLAKLPDAGVYHTLSTGYAGMLAARAKLETGRPMVVTEHGIYTTERRIEIASAGWLEETTSRTLTIDRTRLNLRDLWINSFTTYSRICYEAADSIITLFEGNQDAQRADGAEPNKMHIISNGVDIERFAKITRKKKPYPVIALIGRVVPIKDIKNFIRTCAIVRGRLPDLKAYVIGPTDEDTEYYLECVSMVDHLGLQDTVTFTGKVMIDEYLASIDVLVLTSISEAQPLSVLEAGACGIPSVTTNVGACRELILGKSDERPALGDGGIIAPLSNPAAVAEGILKLLTQPEFYARCSEAIRQRVALYYNKNDQHAAYRSLYGSFLGER